MSKEQAPAADVVKVDTLEDAVQVFDMTLDDFCRDTSTNDSRVELLSAFAAGERAAGNVKAPAAIFAERYAAFASEPA